MTRIKWIDVAKGIGICLVVLGHTFIPEQLDTWIFSFHMPLFFFLSGHLFSTSKTPTLRSFIMKKTRSLLIPYFFFSFISYFFWIVAVYPGSSVEWYVPLVGIFYSNGIEDWMQHNIPLWFLTCLFVVEHLYFLMNKIIQSRGVLRFIVLIALSLIGYIDSLYMPIRLPWGIDVALTAVVFYGIGHLSVNLIKELNKKSFITKLALAMASFMVNFLTQHRIDMNYNEYGNIFGFYIAAISGILAVLLFSQLIENVDLLSFLGTNSLIIMSLHAITLKIAFITYKLLSVQIENSVMWNIMASIVAIIIIIPAIIILNRFPVLLGKKPIFQKGIEKIRLFNT